MMAVLRVSPTDPSGFANPQYKIFKPYSGWNNANERLDKILSQYHQKRAASEGGGFRLVDNMVEITQSEAEPLWKLQLRRCLTTACTSATSCLSVEASLNAHTARACVSSRCSVVRF